MKCDAVEDFICQKVKRRTKEEETMGNSKRQWQRSKTSVNKRLEVIRRRQHRPPTSCIVLGEPVRYGGPRRQR